VTPAGKFTEDQLVERPAIALFAQLGWTTVNAMQETLGPDGTLGRDNQSEVVLRRPLREALERLNPELPAEAISKAVEEISKDRSAVDHVRANREVYALVRDGVRVKVRTEDGSESPEVVRVINWDPDDPTPNDFLLVSQFRIHADLYKRRADLIGFVNGLPLVFIELKASHKNLRNAYDGNLRDYRAAVPRMFQPNAFILLSNGAESKIGTVSSEWEHFADWKKITSEGEAGVVSLETIIRGTCEPSRLLDLVENFLAYIERPGGLVKLVAKNHQFLGVNNALDRLDELADAPPQERGRLGVFWHTQGSGKTMSMLFFSQKVLRKKPGNWTFVIVTDRAALDDQVYGEFTDAGVLTEGHVQATSGDHLKHLLAEDHRYVFTLIQKFRIERGETYPVISPRSDVIVITDEAHRSQYDVLALNMRNALPNAGFLGFTGTPLIAGEERTREVFGDYVSQYNFGASITDGATVPLFYENRIPELQLANESFDDDLNAILEEAELDEAQEAKLARLFSQQYALVTRAERLDRVAADLVEHFLGRGFAGKAMVVSIDKATAVRMYDKVREHWDARIAADTERLADPTLEEWERDQVSAEIAYMRATDIAVVVSQAQNEIADMAAKGLEILPHRKRMVDEDLESRFKDPSDPLRIVFVCAMWTTGFDVPSCSTIYLDKPMKGHTLMQTIARANRVFPEKNNGLIVDYIGVFRNLEAALAIYAAPSDGGDAMPVKDKAELVGWLQAASNNARAYCVKLGINVDALLAATGFELVALGEDSVELILVDDETKAQFVTHARLVDRLFKAMLPDPQANRFGPLRAVLLFLAEALAQKNPSVDVSHVMAKVEQLLDESVAANAYLIHGAEGSLIGDPIDLNKVDWQKLAERMAKGKKRTEAEKLRRAVAAKASALARLNPTRIDWLERFQKLIDDYNAGSVNVEEFFKQLVTFAQGLNEEERRGLAEHLDEEQLAIYDLLMRPAPALTDVEIIQVKKVAESLLELLRREKLVLDWRKEQQSRAAVRLAVETKLDELPDKFEADLYRQKCEAVYGHIFDSYWDDGRSIYDGPLGP
jgi:type I restriction enzyme R subunit